MRKRIANDTTMAFSVEKRYSQYFRQLDDKAQARYKEKLQILGGIENPYVEGSNQTISIDRVFHVGPVVPVGLARLEYPDIYKYLVK